MCLEPPDELAMIKPIPTKAQAKAIELSIPTAIRRTAPISTPIPKAFMLPGTPLLIRLYCLTTSQFVTAPKPSVTRSVCKRALRGAARAASFWTKDRKRARFEKALRDWRALGGLFKQYCLAFQLSKYLSGIVYLLRCV